MPTAKTAIHSVVLAFTLGLLAPQDAFAKTLRIALSAAPPGLGNPYSSTGVSTQLTWAAIFDGLTMIDRDGSVVPWLATDWVPTNDTTWRISIRSDVKFHNGRSLDATAVKQVFDYLLSEDSITDTARREIEGVISSRVVEALTLEITTSEPFPDLPRNLAAIKIADMNHWENRGRDTFARNPIGTGPFRVQTWGPNRIVLESADNPWKPPHVQRLEFSVLTDAPSRLQAFLADQVDIAFQLGPDDIPVIEAANGQIYVRELFGVLTLALQTLEPGPFQDQRVRQAVNMAVDRQALVDLLLGGYARPATQPAARGTFGYDPSLSAFPYDPEGARSLLAEAGYPDGFAFTLEATVGTGPNDSLIFQKIAGDLAKVSVNMTIRTITYPQLVSRILTGNWEGTALSLDYAAAPSLNALRAFQLHSCSWSAPWYCDESVMPLIDRARTEENDEKREALVRQVVKHHRDVAQSLFLYDQIAFDALSSNVLNYHPRTILINYDEIDLVD